MVSVSRTVCLLICRKFLKLWLRKLPVNKLFSMKTIHLSAGITIAFLLSFAACKKESAGTARSQTLLGTWAMEAGGTDSNLNRQLDPSEKEPSEPGYLSTITFLAGGKAVNHFRENANAPLTVDSNIQWKLRENDKYLDLYLPLFSSKTDTFPAEIIVLDEARLELYFDGPYFPQISVNRRQ